MLRRVGTAVMLLVLVTRGAAAFQPPQVPEGFVQVTEVPPGEQLPAAPFLIAAYAFFLVLMIGYVWSIARRLNRVEREMEALQRGSAHSAQGASS